MDHCVFVHFGSKDRLPFPEFSYLSQLAKRFSRVTVVTNERDFRLENLPGHVGLKMVKNEGYDFGMFYKVFQGLDLTGLERLALVNDSNVLLGDLSQLMERGRELQAGFWGAIDSYERPWYSTHRESYHLQSHFLVWEKDALPVLQKYLNLVSLETVFAESSPKEIRRKVIDLWEIGLSQYFVSEGFAPRAVFQSESLASILGRKKSLNFTVKAPGELLGLGYPFLKKRCIVKRGFWQRLFFSRRVWENLVKTHAKSTAEAEFLVDYFEKESN